MIIDVLRRSAAVTLCALAAASVACGAAPTDGAPATDHADPEPAAQSSEALTGAVECGAFVRSHMDYVRSNHCSYGGLVAYTIVTHQSSGLISVSRGSLNAQSPALYYINPITHLPFSVPGTLFSSGTYDGYQTFSDRSVYATPQGSTHASYFSFNPNAEDQVKVTLRDDGKAIVKLVSWGGGEITVTPTECMNGLMYGFGNGTLYSIRLEDQCVLG